jgi:hypothetical protein
MKGAAMKILSSVQVLVPLAVMLSLATPAATQQPLEPVALPPAVEQGVDMVYVDREIGGNIRWRNTKLDNVTFARYAGAPLDLGSGLINHSQKMTVAAMQMADMKVCAHRS